MEKIKIKIKKNTIKNKILKKNTIKNKILKKKKNIYIYL